MLIDRIYNTFIPDDLSIMMNAYAKNLIGACIISIFASPAYALLYYSLNYPEASYAIIINEIFLLVPLLILKYFRSLFFANLLFITTLTCLIIWLTYNLGGLYSPTAFWLILPPLVAEFIGGVKAGFFWCFISIIATSIFYTMQHLNYQFPIAQIDKPLFLQYTAICGLSLVIILLAFFYEIGKKTILAKLNYMAYHDVLTDIHNRVSYEEILKSAIDKANNTKTPFSIFYFDIDNFNKINLIFGKSIGNILLKEVANRIKRHLPDIDTIARVGGDEFKIIVNNIKDTEAINEIAQIMLLALKIPYHILQREIKVTVSIGIATYLPEGSKYENIDRYVDIALSKAKYLGGNHYQYFTGELAHELELEVIIEKNLPLALLNNEISLNFQPQFSASNPKKITGLEALLRWHSDKYGDIPSEKFIPIAEKIDMISQLGLWILKEACHQYIEWIHEGLINDDITLAINISPRQLYDENFISSIISILIETGVAPHNLELELTETAVISNQAFAITILSQLKEIGIRTVIDDFGVGNTSLGYLTTLPVSGLKIDKLFVDNMLNIESKHSIVTKSIVDLAHQLNLTVVVEGVENIEQLNYLREINCDYIQGYYLSKPSNIANTRILLEANKNL